MHNIILKVETALTNTWKVELLRTNLNLSFKYLLTVTDVTGFAVGHVS